MFEISVFRVEVIKWPPLVFPVTLATDETAQHCIAGSAAATGKIRQLIDKKKQLRASAAVEQLIAAKDEVVEDGHKEVAKDEVMTKEEEEEAAAQVDGTEEAEWYAKAAEPPPPPKANLAWRKMKGLTRVGKAKAQMPKKPKRSMPLKSKAPPAKRKPLARGSVAAQVPVAGLGPKIVFSIVYILNESLMFSPQESLMLNVSL